MKLLLDMNLPARWVQYLIEAGFEAVCWSRLGAVTAPDAEKSWKKGPCLP